MRSVAPGILSFITLLVVPSFGRNITVLNQCPYTIWPGVFTDPAASAGTAETGWEAAPKSSKTLSVRDDWNSGRIWARSGCIFTAAGSGKCVTGGCEGGLKCAGPPVGPVTVTEWALSSSGADYYDVSLADGFNIPVRITNSKSCSPVLSCAVDLNANCPEPLRGPSDASGKVLGCQSACGANLDGTPENSKNCCTGQYSTPSTCPRTGVQYYSYFKNACPEAIVYAYDYSTSTGPICTSKPDYTITFCP